MPLYFGRHYRSARVGGRVVSVECGKCGCRYFYELARIGSGSATAPYGIGTSSAARSAEEQSQRDLRERLALEAELVPCPKCNWINEELVRGYRQGRYRRAGLLAASIVVVGTSGSLVCAWFISNGPAADRAARPYFLFGGPAIFVSLALVIIFLRSWLRSRIQPNRNFPLAPELPPGSPPALIENPATGELQKATRQDRQLASRGVYEFQIGRHNLPLVCCSCLKSAALENPYKLPVAAGIELRFPRCGECARAARRTYQLILCTVAAIALLIGSGLSAALRLQAHEFWILIAALFLISLGLGAYVASKITAPVTTSGGDSSRGIVKLRFRNQEYGTALDTQIEEPR